MGKHTDGKADALRREYEDLSREISTMRQLRARLEEETLAARKALDAMRQSLAAYSFESLDALEALDALSAQDALDSMDSADGSMCAVCPENVICQTGENCGDCGACPSFDLCRQRILIVGGIERMESQYRKLVEDDGGGILEYHAGHMRGGKKQLEQSLQRADVVLCPVNCNSHGACKLVKNLAKKYCKTVHMMPNFSLNAIAGVINAHCETLKQ